MPDFDVGLYCGIVKNHKADWTVAMIKALVSSGSLISFHFHPDLRLAGVTTRSESKTTIYERSWSGGEGN